MSIGGTTVALVPGGVFDTNAHGLLHTSPLSRTTEMVPDKIPRIVAAYVGIGDRFALLVPLQLPSTGSDAVADLRDDYAGNNDKQSNRSHGRQGSQSGPRQCKVVNSRRSD
jgi:hypothetical protein